MTKTFAEITERLRTAGPTLDITDVADLLGFKRSTFYEAVKTGTSPVRTIRARNRIKVLTRSVADALGVDLDSPDHVRSSETLDETRRSEVTAGPCTSPRIKCAPPICQRCGASIDPGTT